VSEILTLQTETTTRAFAERHVLDPIGLEISDWWQSTSGVHIGGAEIFMTARDMARVGLLLLSQGMWDGHEIIPVEWVHECVAYHSEGQPFVGSYGYGWWRRSIDGHPAFIGKGYGGQFIVVVPDLDLVVVVGSDMSSPEMSPTIEHWVCETVVPAAFQSK
jgi:CubicO group peptidase (beta-lactamase class C family)